MFESALEVLTGSDWAYALLLAFAAADVLFPVVPSEAALIAAGVAAGIGDLDVATVIGAGAAGAIAGDNASYLVGRRVGRPVVDRLFRGCNARERLARIERLLGTRGPEIIVVARFVPGGRTAATLSAGITRLRWPTRFLPYTLVAGLVWASYATLLGYLGGRLFVDRPLLGLLVALALAGLVVGGVEAVRHARARRRPPVP
jgi:membrane protein DedA with SNARE-associated domain